MDILSFFLHKIVVYRHFYIFNMASKITAKGNVTIFIVIGSNKFYILTKFCESFISQQNVEWF